MTDVERRKFVDVHNKYRSLVARGEAVDKASKSKYAPMAARMKKMIYDCGLETSAMKVAKKCIFQRSGKLTSLPYGENVWMTTAVKRDKALTAEQACENWFSELERFGVGLDNILTVALWNRPRTQIGQYTQMVWQETYKVGCYVEWCDKMTLAVCHYSPKGNTPNKPIYENGSPCKTDAECKCTNCRCSKSEALCIVQ
ncbi:hypothetical protein Aduo_013227 [Ancylostoma duodenale]